MSSFVLQGEREFWIIFCGLPMIYDMLMNLLVYFFPLPFHFISNVSRFVLEPKSALMSEQEQKLKDSEAAIAGLQVCFSAFFLSM